MSQQERAPAADVERPKAIKAFFNADPKAPVVDLWVNPRNLTLDVPKLSAMFGKIAGRSVTCWLQPAGTATETGRPYGPFVTINERGAPVEGQPGKYHRDVHIGMAHFVVKDDARVALVINLDGAKAIWGEPRKELTEELRFKLGVDPTKLAEAIANKATAAAQPRRPGPRP